MGYADIVLCKCAASGRAGGSHFNQGIKKKMAISRFWLFLAFLTLALMAGGNIRAAGGPLVSDGEDHPDAQIVTAPVEIDGHVLFRVRGMSSLTASDRAAAIRERIERAASNPSITVASVRVVEAEDFSALMAGDLRIMALFDADARIEQVKRTTLGWGYRDSIASAIERFRLERSPDVLRRHLLEAAAATLAFVGALALLTWLFRRIKGLLETRYRRRIQNLGIQSFEIVRAENIWRALYAAVSGLQILIIAAAIFAYLEFVLGRFPWTRRFATNLMADVLRPIKGAGLDLLDYLPNLVFLLVLCFVIRFSLRLVRLFFDSVARGRVVFAAFEAEWALPTYKIVRFVILALAVIVAYPYIPGSDSAAFKGVSLLIGVVISLGSSSAMANTLAGLMLVYRRAFRVGDRVRIGEVLGDVTAVRLQVTHLRTLKNEEVTIPNSTIVNGHVVNYSALASNRGLILHAKVGIGYETPWRQVEAMLLEAAARTSGLLSEPRPFVLHESLDTFCVVYEINAFCNEAKAMERLHTELLRNILDLFNEYGVQIMTPAYEGDPKTPKIVPKELWYATPAIPETTER